MSAKKPRLSYGLTLKLNGRWTWSVIFSRFPLSGCKMECDIDFETEKEAEEDRKKVMGLLGKTLNCRKSRVGTSAMWEKMKKELENYNTLGAPWPKNQYERASIRAAIKRGDVVQVFGASIWHCLFLKEYAPNEPKN